MENLNCPRHGLGLTFRHTLVTVQGVSLPCVIGECPQCRCRYINRQIFPSSGSVKIGDQEYVFHPGLNRSFPPAEAPLPEPPTPVQQPSGSTKKPRKSKKSKKAKKQDLTPAQEARKERKAKASQPKSKKAKKLWQAPVPKYPPARPEFLETVPPVCPRDGQKLSVGKTVEFALEGAHVRTAASFCPLCRTAYMDREKEQLLLQRIRARHGTSAPVTAAPAAPPVPAGSVQTLQKLPLSSSGSSLCPFCGQPPHRRVHVRYPSRKPGHPVTWKYAQLWQCEDCQVLYADRQQLADLKAWNENARFETLSSADFSSGPAMMQAALGKASQPPGAELPFRHWGPKPDNLSDRNRVVLVYSQKCHCRKCRERYGRETTVNRTALARGADGSQVRVNVIFCQGCGQYFISMAVLEQYKSLCGGLLMECRAAEDVSREDMNRLHFAPDTILSRCGYTVRSGVTLQYRRAVLRYILDSGKAQKYELLEKMAGFIQLRENLPNLQEARQKWREDMKYVSEYHLDKQQQVSGLTFRRP